MDTVLVTVLGTVMGTVLPPPAVFETEAENEVPPGKKMEFVVAAGHGVVAPTTVVPPTGVLIVCGLFGCVGDGAKMFASCDCC